MTREEQNRRISELMDWTLGDLALHITLLETALHDLASDELYRRQMAEWHDVGSLTRGVQDLARKALET